DIAADQAATAAAAGRGIVEQANIVRGAGRAGRGAVAGVAGGSVGAVEHAGIVGGEGVAGAAAAVAGVGAAAVERRNVGGLGLRRAGRIAALAGRIAGAIEHRGVGRGQAGRLTVVRVAGAGAGAV